MRRCFYLLSVVLLAGCGSDGSSAEPIQEAPAGQLPTVNCHDGQPIPTYADLSTGIFAKCEHCHDSTKTGVDRKDAPSDVNFDVELTAKEHAKQAASAVYTAYMPPDFPPPDNITVTDEEKQSLYRWALCGMP
jgi:uncharacterized membrane protein